MVGSATQVTPPVIGSAAPTHRIDLRKKGERYTVTLVSKSIDLDGLATTSSVVTSVQLGFQSASATDEARTTRRGVTF